jgi:putative redox protein
MPRFKIKYDGNFNTTAIHEDSGTRLITAAPKDNQGDGSSFSPTDLLCVSLATCKLTTMAIKAKSMNVNLEGVEMKVQKIMTSTPPRKVGEVIIDLIWNGKDKNITPEQMESLKRSAHHCPVALSLDASVKVTLNWE